MHLKNLKIFCEIVDCGSFSRAAAKNRISQPAASQVVQHLEEKLGVKLIDRSRRPFVLTSEGKHFHTGCRDIVKRCEELTQQVSHMHDEASTHVRVAAIYSVGLALMSRFIQEFSAQFPRTQVQLEYLHPDRVYEVIEHGEADLGLVSYPTASNTIATINWRAEPMVLVCSPQAPLAARKKAPLESLRGKKFIAFREGLRIREEIDLALSLRKIEIDIVHEFDNIEFIKRALETSESMSILPLPTVQQEISLKTLVAIPLAGQQLSRPLGIIFRRDSTLNNTAKQLIELLQATEPSQGNFRVNGAVQRPPEFSI